MSPALRLAELAKTLLWSQTGLTPRAVRARHLGIGAQRQQPQLGGACLTRDRHRNMVTASATFMHVVSRSSAVMLHLHVLEVHPPSA